MNHFASVERSAHVSVAGSLLLQVSRVPLGKPSTSFPEKCLLEPREGLIFSTLLRDATQHDCVLLQREEESSISQTAGTSSIAPLRMVVLPREA